MSLPAAWVDRIFTKLTLQYGEAFMRTYAGLDIADVKLNWGHELSGFFTSPLAIQHGLSNLPERPPNVIEFRALCRRAPAGAFGNQLPAPKHEPVDPEGVKRVTEQLKNLKPELHHSSRAWAYALRERDRRGKGITRAQRDMYQAVIGTD